MDVKTFADTANGLFEAFGAVFILFSIFRLYKDKEVKGIHLAHPLFFWAWGLWNCFYYPAVGSFFSFFAGIAVLITNSIWMTMIFYYRRERATDHWVKTNDGP